MSFLRLALCVAGVYSMFLLWAIAQERRLYFVSHPKAPVLNISILLVSVPFQSADGLSSESFRSALFMGTCQSGLSSISALIYILVRRQPGQSLSQCFGLASTSTVGEPTRNGVFNGNSPANGHSHHVQGASYNPMWRTLLLRYLQCAIFITAAAPFGFAALSYISYPAMVLGKSCKLVPVLIMNVLLYRRRFPPHKYLVVFMVTAGITIFMGMGSEGSSKAKAKTQIGGSTSTYANTIGITYLLINLAIDGATNSTQDEIFARYKVTGQQMMFWINLFCTGITTILSILSLPYIPVIHPSHDGTELMSALAFIRSHPSIVMPLTQFALTGALGQLFIFETLQRFGSLTLVTITLTRKLFTMLLSVVVYNHKLTLGQWIGAAVVFAGISVEAIAKQKNIQPNRVKQGMKATLKSL